MTLLHISVLILTSYIVFAINTAGMQESLSATYYVVKPKWIFQLVMGVVGALMLVYLLDKTAGKWYQFLSFFATSALIFVAFSPDYKDKLEGKVHRVSAGVSAAAALLILLFSGFILLPLCLLFIAYLISLKFGNRTFWLEIACFTSVFVTLFLKFN